jgi:hypothetical protein
MKKFNVLMMLLLALTSLRTLAQSDTSHSIPVKSGNEWQMPRDVLIRSKNFADSLQKLLGLDEPTKKKVFDAYLANTKPVDEIRVSGQPEQQKKAALAANQEKFVQTMKGILTASQFERYVKWIDKEKARPK